MAKIPMKKNISLLNEHLFTFVAIVIIFSILISIYMMIAPEKSRKINFSPFPKVAPTDLPDPSRPTDNCWNQLTPCDSHGDCSACSMDEYECKTVTKEEADNKFYHYNGINVPEGKWCLPKDHNPAPCNTYTGRYVWVFDEEYCNSVTPGKSQCWKCECLYPSMFGDSSTGCTAQFACQNDSPMSNSLEQPDNQLAPTKCSLPEFKDKGLVWNPAKEQKNEGSLYQYTPYDTDLEGNPWFTCDCRSEVQGQWFTQLPGDPYSCHLEPCYKSLGYSSQGLTKDCGNNCGKSGNCTCECEGTNIAKSPSGKYKDTCVLIENACDYGFDREKGVCNCPAPNWERKCRSPNTGVNMDKMSLPECTRPENALGTECVDPCETAKCAHSAVCLSCGPSSWKTNGMCNMDSWNPITEMDGKKIDTAEKCTSLCKEIGCVESTFDNNICYMHFRDHDQVHSMCDCRTAKGKPQKPFSGWSGKNCETACLPEGARVKSHLFWKTCSCYNCSCCCSQNDKRSGDFWGIAYHEDCTGGYPYPPNDPPDPECSPAEGCPASSDAGCGVNLHC